MADKSIDLGKVRIVTGITADTIPTDELFAAKGKDIVLGALPWHLDAYTGGTSSADSTPVLLRFTLDIQNGGFFCLGFGGDWWTRFWVDGKQVCEAQGDTPPETDNHQIILELTSGIHSLDVYFSRGDATADLAMELNFIGENLEEGVNLSKDTGRIRKELHGANTTLILSSRYLNKYEEPLRKLNFTWARTHDWPLWNAGQRIIDTHFIFPLMHEDPSDPANYYFKATDEIIRLTQDVAGIKVFYRLGTSIEHTGDPHFNIFPPEDPVKYAEVLAGIVRHYTQGWADGFHYDIKYWEIWNEPEGQRNMWAAPYEETFPPFFVTVLKRLKQEFPELQFGGPAMCGPNIPRFKPLMDACKAAGIAPDFISWHGYSADADAQINAPRRMRKWLDKEGFTATKLCINEWHYLETWQGVQSSASPEEYRKAMMELQGINSGVYNLAVLSGWHETPLDLGMWYGASWDSPAWGYRNVWREFTKNYWSMAMFGQFIRDYTVKCHSCMLRNFNLYVLAGRSEDGHKAGIIVADYKGKGTEISFPLKGAESYRTISAIILDEQRDNEPVPVELRNGELILTKAAPGSAAFMIMLEK